MPTWCGIDPGLSGAVAFIGPEGSLKASVFPLPLVDSAGQDELDSDALAGWLEAYSPDIICLERIQGFGGCSSASKLGQSYGSLITTALSGRFRLERVRPQAWQRVMLPDIHGREALKSASVARAKALFPTANFSRAGRTKADDKADALLLAAYAREMWQ